MLKNNKIKIQKVKKLKINKKVKIKTDNFLKTIETHNKYLKYMDVKAKENYSISIYDHNQTLNEIKIIYLVVNDNISF